MYSPTVQCQVLKTKLKVNDISVFSEMSEVSNSNRDNFEVAIDPVLCFSQLSEDPLPVFSNIASSSDEGT